MSLAGLREKMKRFDKKAEVIFDREEPVGRPTDMVMPVKERRFPGRRKTEKGRPGERPSLTAAPNTK